MEIRHLHHAFNGSTRHFFSSPMAMGNSAGKSNFARASNNTLLFALYRMGYRGRMTGHGFRGGASTILHEQGWPHEHIELQLAHQERNAVSAAYNHALYLKPRAEMMQAWADHMDALRKGYERKRLVRAA
jgi:integrase